MLPISLESQAYVLFVEEVDKHLAFAHEVFVVDAPVAADTAKRLGAAFHTIRGSAGFFGLAEIADLSRRLEENFFAAAAGMDLKAKEAKYDLDRLVALTNPLPRPGAAS